MRPIQLMRDFFPVAATLGGYLLWFAFCVFFFDAWRCPPAHRFFTCGCCNVVGSRFGDFDSTLRQLGWITHRAAARGSDFPFSTIKGPIQSEVCSLALHHSHALSLCDPPRSLFILDAAEPAAALK